MTHFGKNKATFTTHKNQGNKACLSPLFLLLFQQLVVIICRKSIIKQAEHQASGDPFHDRAKMRQAYRPVQLEEK
jgi:hypothetical protein